MLVFIVFVIVILVIFSLLKDRNPYWLDKFNDNLDTYLFITGLFFSIIGLLYMKGIITLGVTDTNYTISGLSIVAFGISLFSMSGSIYQTRKSNEETIQFKNDINSKLDEISNKFESLNPSNEDLHNEIEKLKEQNQEIIGLLKEKNQTNVHIYVNEEDKNKKTRKNGEYKK